MGLTVFLLQCLMYKKLQDSQHRNRLANELMIFHMQVCLPFLKIIWKITLQAKVRIYYAQNYHCSMIKGYLKDQLYCSCQNLYHFFLAWSKAFNNFFYFSCQNMYCTCIILSHLWLFLYLLTGMFVLHLSLDVFEFPLNTFGHPIIVKVFFLLHEF